MTERKSSRLILLNDKNEIFMFLYDFMEWGDDHKAWIVPGGGEEPGETIDETLSREIQEELGLYIHEKLPLVYTQNHVLRNDKGEEILSVESFFLLKGKEQDFNFTGWTEGEKVYTKSWKWWSLDELQTTKENFFCEEIGDWFESILKWNEGGGTYQQGMKFAELWMNLEDFKLPVIPKNLEQFSFCFASKEDYPALIEAVEEVEPHWVRYFKPEDTFFLTKKNNQILGFTIVDFHDHCIKSRGNNQIGTIGCVGVIPAARKNGIGLFMVAYATLELKRAGCTHASIHYTSLERWYQKLGYKTYLDYTFWNGEKTNDNGCL